MSSVQELRDLLASHEAADSWRLFRMALDVMQEQQTQLDELKQELQRAKAHHDEHVMTLNRRIDKLKGVHGA